MNKEQEAKALDLMAIVSHELMSPVATIHTTVDTLRGGYFGEFSPEQRKGLETILRNCQYLEDIICCYTDLVKMELDDIAFKQGPIDFAKDVVEVIVNRPEYQGNLKTMPIATAYSPIPPVMGDADPLKITVNNLLNNAIKYGNPGSIVKIGVFQEGDFAVLSIRNEGPGIAAEDIQNRLFKRFERLKQKGTEGVKGSGLGLYICRQIVEKHGGRIEARSDGQSFTEFRVYLKFV
ncbi:MAG: sensor histidine kinase [Betaproteobacteria bacterium]